MKKNLFPYSIELSTQKESSPIIRFYRHEGDLALPILLVSAASIGIFIYRLLNHFQK